MSVEVLILPNAYVPIAKLSKWYTMKFEVMNHITKNIDKTKVDYRVVVYKQKDDKCFSISFHNLTDQEKLELVGIKLTYA